MVISHIFLGYTHMVISDIILGLRIWYYLIFIKDYAYGDILYIFRFTHMVISDIFLGLRIW